MDNYSERLATLEKMQRKIEIFYTMKNLDWSSNVSELKRELQSYRDELAEMSEEMQRLKRIFLNGVDELKYTILNEDYIKFKRKLKNWPLEQFITKKEFNDLMKQRL